jgi:hypothetical protein
MRILIGLISMTLLLPVVAEGQAFPYRGQSAFANGSDQGDVSIQSEKDVVRKGDVYSVRYTFHVVNSSYAVYNWQFISLKPLPGQLALYDSNKQYLGNLIAFAGGSQVGISDDDWTFFYGETFVGKPLGFRAGLIPNTKYDSTNHLLPSGDYYIQLILYRAFVSPNPFRLLGEKVNFYKTFDRTELCRSDVLKIQLVD